MCHIIDAKQEKKFIDMSATTEYESFVDKKKEKKRKKKTNCKTTLISACLV